MLYKKKLRYYYNNNIFYLDIATMCSLHKYIDTFVARRKKTH